MEYSLLKSINSPSDLCKLKPNELENLCEEIRSFLIDSVSKTGGHLSSNLGVIELTVAMHRCLQSPKDVILFDVGHQSYTHKLLTGRMDEFSKLRQAGGLSGFPCASESEHDRFVAGHGSAALSAAIGIGRAKKMRGEDGIVVVVVGDGAFTGGMIYEALLNVNDLDNLVIILNDNNMSISKNVGALAHYLNNLRASHGYNKAKTDVKNVLDNTPVIGGGVKKSIQSVKLALRQGLYNSTFFEDIGLRYLGPLNGHDLMGLIDVFEGITDHHKPLLLHIATKKGKGFIPAEKNPGAFHGVSSFDVQKIRDPDIMPGKSFSTVFGKNLSTLASKNQKICAITAAMKYGTGLQYMKRNHLDRFFDVGMAEEHAVTYAAGLASGGMMPVVALYSTFLQRAYDQIIHDVMLGKHNVLFAIDRAGLVPGDGETHQGIYDAAFLSQHPDMIVVSVSNYIETAFWLKKLLEEYDGPKALRYPRGTEPQELSQKPCTGEKYDWLCKNNKSDVAIVSYGTEIKDVLDAEKILTKEGIKADVAQMIWINPLPESLVEDLLSYPAILFAEEGIAHGGIGEHLAMALLHRGYKGKFMYKAVRDNRLDHATAEELKVYCKLDGESLAEDVRVMLKEAP